MQFHDNFPATGCYACPVLPADPGSWKERPPRLALLRAVAAVPLFAAMGLAWRQWQDVGRRVRAPWEERSAFSARTLAGGAAEKLDALQARDGIPVTFADDAGPLALRSPRTSATFKAAEGAEALLADLRKGERPADPALLRQFAANHPEAVTGAGLPALPLLWYTAATAGKPPLPPEIWARDLAESALANPSLITGRILERALSLAAASRTPPSPPNSSVPADSKPSSNSLAILQTEPPPETGGPPQAQKLLTAALHRWREMEALLVSLGPAVDFPPVNNADAFWTADGAWLVSPVAAESHPDHSRTFRGLRAEQVREQAVATLTPTDSRLSHKVEIAGKTWQDVTAPGVPAEAGPSAETGGIHAEASLGPVTVRVRLRGADALAAELAGERRTLLALPVLAALSGLGGWLALERALRRQQRLGRMKTDFVSSVSHELRAPVAGIRLLAERMAAGKADPAQTADYSRLIEREARRVSALVENVLDFARIENGRKAWHFKPCDPALVLCEAVETMEPLAAARSVRLLLEAGTHSPGDQRMNPAADVLTNRSAEAPRPVFADADALRQAVVNLIDNAVKFSVAGAVVHIALKTGSTAVRFIITDHGCGIPDAELPWIFDRFYRGGDELSRGTPGAGIGLSLVRHIAEAHGGTIRVKTKPGLGSEFTLSIPCPEPENP